MAESDSSDDSLDDLIATKKQPTGDAPPIAAPVPAQAPAPAPVAVTNDQVEWTEQAHKELTELHQVLQSQRHELREREAALEKRERALAQDAVLVRDVLAKEARRLEEESRAALDTRAVTHHERLETAINVLRGQCDQLREAKNRAALELKASLASLREAKANHEVTAEAPAPEKQGRSGRTVASAAEPLPTQAQLRELRQRLSRSHDLSAALLSLHAAPEQSAADETAQRVEEAHRQALPGATDALIAAVSRESRLRDGRVEALLRLLWAASAHGAKASTRPKPVEEP